TDLRTDHVRRVQSAPDSHLHGRIIHPLFGEVKESYGRFQLELGDRAITLRLDRLGVRPDGGNEPRKILARDHLALDLYALPHVVDVGRKVAADVESVRA